MNVPRSGGVDGGCHVFARVRLNAIKAELTSPPGCGMDGRGGSTLAASDEAAFADELVGTISGDLDSELEVFSAPAPLCDCCLLVVSASC